MHSGATRLVAPMLQFAPGSAARCRQASPAAGCMQNPWPVGKRCTSAQVPAACGCVAVCDTQPLIAPLHGCLAGTHGSSTAGDRRRARKCDCRPVTSAAPPLTLPQELRGVPATQEAMAPPGIYLPAHLRSRKHASTLPPRTGSRQGAASPASISTGPALGRVCCETAEAAAARAASKSAAAGSTALPATCM